MPDNDDDEEYDTEDTDDGFKDIETIEDNSDLNRDWCV